jgi:hypothetical protein
MSDVMSFAELTDQHVELLPARTVLSMLHSDIGGTAGAPGQPGTRGADGQSINGQSMSGTSWRMLFGYDPSSGSLTMGDASTKGS